MSWNTSLGRKKNAGGYVLRVVFGSIERFIAILTEHFAGAFPLWLSPVQVSVLPITDRVNDYAQSVADLLSSEGFRVETDFRNEKIGFKIREGSVQKNPVHAGCEGTRKRKRDNIDPAQRRR